MAGWLALDFFLIDALSDTPYTPLDSGPIPQPINGTDLSGEAEEHAGNDEPAVGRVSNPRMTDP